MNHRGITIHQDIVTQPCLHKQYVRLSTSFLSTVFLLTLPSCQPLRRWIGPHAPCTHQFPGSTEGSPAKNLLRLDLQNHITSIILKTVQPTRLSIEPGSQALGKRAISIHVATLPCQDGNPNAPETSHGTPSVRYPRVRAPMVDVEINGRSAGMRIDGAWMLFGGAEREGVKMDEICPRLREKDVI